MASLTFYKGKAKGNQICAFFHLKKEAMDLKGSKVMAVRLETGRSSPGQDEGERKLAGGLKGS